MPEIDSTGYFSELFSSIQGEGGMVRGSCFGKRQIFVRFSGCNLINGEFGSSGCYWCDSPQARDLKNGKLMYEKSPGSQILSSEESPVKISKIIHIIKNLITPDLHSISFTGGEPLYQLDAVISLCNALKKENMKYPLYLETNGTIALIEEQASYLAKYFSYCCCDIKDRSANAASFEKWENLVKSELDFITQMANREVEVFAKLVVTSKTKIKDLQWILKHLSSIRLSDRQAVGLAIQPAIIRNEQLKNTISISPQYLNQIFEIAAGFIPIESLSLSIQAQKMIDLL
ncbi:MAG: 4Fe-4S cluster-binding domain-containing protein [Promethearchaeota archaeon]